MTQPPTEYFAVDLTDQPVTWPDETDLSRLYYEAHVTIPPLDNRQTGEVDTLCSQLGWRRSTFVLHKDGIVPNAFVSMRHESRHAILQATASMVQRLRGLGYTVLRWKIEDTLLDSNKGDTLLPVGAPEASLSPPTPRVGIYDAPSTLTPPPEES